jgi:hypothetical protein
MRSPRKLVNEACRAAILTLATISIVGPTWAQLPVSVSTIEALYPVGEDVKGMSNVQLAQNIRSLLTLHRGPGSLFDPESQTHKLWQSGFTDVVATNFDLPDGTIVEMCIQVKPGGLCPSGFAQVLVDDAKELVSYARKSTADHVTEINKRGATRLHQVYRVGFTGQCERFAPATREFRIDQQGHLLETSPRQFFGVTVSTAVVLVSTRPLGPVTPSRVLTGSIRDGKVTLQGLNFDCTVSMLPVFPAPRNVVP